MKYIKKALPIIAFILVFVAWGLYSEAVQGNIAGNVIRLHILANSNSPEDQALKLMVRDKVLSELSKIMTGDETLEEARAILDANKTDIEGWAAEILSENGADYPVSASLEDCYFPSRTYMDASLPAGVYESLRLEIGSAEGNNWWCIMFPPLCFVDAAAGVEDTGDSALALEEALSAESYAVVAEGGPVKIKFKTVEMWQELMNVFRQE